MHTHTHHRESQLAAEKNLVFEVSSWDVAYYLKWIFGCSLWGEQLVASLFRGPLAFGCGLGATTAFEVYKFEFTTNLDNNYYVCTVE